MAESGTYWPITSSNDGKSMRDGSAKLGRFLIGRDHLGKGDRFSTATQWPVLDNATQGYSSVGNNSQTYSRVDGGND